MQPSDTAYPRLKSRFSQTELDRFYTPTNAELIFCDNTARARSTRLGFVLLLKTYQCLGYFVTSNQVPTAIIEHIAGCITKRCDRNSLQQYDVSQAKRKHLSAVRNFLAVKAFDNEGKELIQKTFNEAALIKEYIINIGIEMLVLHRYELPAFDTLVREARLQRVLANQVLQAQIFAGLGNDGQTFLDKLFVVGNDPRRVSPWNDFKQDNTKPTLYGISVLLERYDCLTSLACYTSLLKSIPVVKIKQWALESNSLDATSMINMSAAKRYAVTLSLIQFRLARVTDDLCIIFCKQMMRVLHKAEETLERYLIDNQDKTDEILRRFAMLETVLDSDQSEAEQLNNIRQTVMDRPDLFEFSRLHTESGGKNECRFVWNNFKQRRSQLLRILNKLKVVATTQDTSFERSLVFMLKNSYRQSDWLLLKNNEKTTLTSDDLQWIPEKWWKLVVGDVQRNAVLTRINRRQFEVCVCLQMVRELNSGDLCVMGSDDYSDYRDELVPMDECERTRSDYGEKVGLPIESTAFIEYVRSKLMTVAQTVDKTYHDNPYFNIIDGRPKLGRQEKKSIPAGFKQLDDALIRKLDSLDLSLLDVLADTLQWIGWGKHFSPLSGHQGKLQEEDRRKIMTVFAYGTGLGPTQIAKNIADISACQVSFVNQRHITTEKLEAAIDMTINAYNHNN